MLQCLLPLKYIHWDSGDSATQIILSIDPGSRAGSGTGEPGKGEGAKSEIRELWKEDPGSF